MARTLDVREITSDLGQQLWPKSRASGIGIAFLRVTVQTLFLVLGFVLSSSLRAESVSLSRELSAADFFKSRPKSASVDPSWPKQLTLKPIELTSEQIHERLPGIWNVFYSCGGGRLSAEWLADQELLDGHFRRGLRLEFGPNTVTQYFVSPRSQGRQFAVISEARPVKYRIVSREAGRTEIVFDERELASFVLSWIQIGETGEVAMAGNYADKCPDGKDLTFLFLPLPFSS